MSMTGILQYVIRASWFALVVCGIYVVARLVISRLRGRQTVWQREIILLAAVFYLAALMQITVIRGGVDWTAVFGSGPHSAVQWLPLYTTLRELQSGAWPFVYHVVGNLIWFVPLGFLMSNKRFGKVVLCACLLSVLIETLQWLLLTGQTDVDDVILNTLGAVLGYGLFRLSGICRCRSVK